MSDIADRLGAYGCLANIDDAMVGAFREGAAEIRRLRKDLQWERDLIAKFVAALETSREGEGKRDG